VAAIDRPFDSGTRRANKWLAQLGEEFRNARLALGLSQAEVARAARIDRSDYSRAEAGKLPNLSVTRACRIGAVLGLDVSVRAFPGGRSIRDASQTPQLLKLVASVGPPLRYRFEVVLPAREDRPEYRAWDLLIVDSSERTAVEYEARLYDLQAQIRRLRLKLRDDPVDHLLLVVADTRPNRRVLDEFADVLADLPRLGTESVLATLRSGQHPPTGIILLKAPVQRRKIGATA
jgi:transcriptional regulator with XRE-family HTH domain